MAIKLNPTKANFVIDLLKANGNTFTPDQLLKVTGNERRARSALSHARMAGIKLEAVRDGGKAVVSYRTTSTPTALAAAPKAAAKPKASKARTKTVTAKQISSEVDAIVARNKSPSKKSDEAVKAANLKTMRAVSAKQKLQRIEDRLTPEQRAIRESFYASEAEIAAEEKAAARASVQEYLKRETYSE
jgi:hypothetical protein